MQNKTVETDEDFTINGPEGQRMIAWSERAESTAMDFRCGFVYPNRNICGKRSGNFQHHAKPHGGLAVATMCAEPFCCHAYQPRCDNCKHGPHTGKCTEQWQDGPSCWDSCVCETPR